MVYLYGAKEKERLFAIIYMIHTTNSRYLKSEITVGPQIQSSSRS